MSTKNKRIITFAINDFKRNKGIAIAAIFVLSITIMLITGLYFFRGITSNLITQIQDKIDITAYFKESALEEDILNVKDEILKMSSDIKNIEYVSREQALVSFNEKHQGNEVLTTALEEVGDNPFPASLNITTNGDSSQYAIISNILETSDFSDLIESVDYTQKKDTIEKVYSITSGVNTIGLILGIILIAIAVLVVFNTIKLVIENSKEEINNMKIVGASNWFIKGPFVIEGAIYGIVSFLICFLISGIIAYFSSPQLGVVLPGFDMFNYFLSNWWVFVMIQLGFGVGVGVVSSAMVVKKYLEV